MPYGTIVDNSVTAAIGNGASLSAAAATGGAALVGILFPAAWTAAAVSFQVSFDGTTFYDLFNQTGEVAIPAAQVAVSRVVMVNPLDFLGAPYLKLRSGLTAAAVNQGAARTLTLVTRPL